MLAVNHTVYNIHEILILQYCRKPSRLMHCAHGRQQLYDIIIYVIVGCRGYVLQGRQTPCVPIFMQNICT